MTAHYFATDGNYGNAENLLVCDTDNWHESDWLRIEHTTDQDRIVVALEISRERK